MPAIATDREISWPFFCYPAENLGRKPMEIHCLFDPACIMTIMENFTSEIDKPKSHVEIELALPEDAADVRRIQAQTWLDTYPNSDQGVSYEGVLRRVEGVHGEKIAEKIQQWRERIETS